jgi:hypothetical protein
MARPERGKERIEGGKRNKKKYKREYTGRRKEGLEKG